MRNLKSFSFANGWNLDVSEHGGMLFFKAFKGEKQYAFFANDQFGYVDAYNGKKFESPADAVWTEGKVSKNGSMFRLIGTRLQMEKAENELTIHTVPTDVQSGGPLARFTAHYRLALAGDNAVRITTWFSCREPLLATHFSWMSFQFDRSKFDTVHAFDPEYTMAVGEMTHGTHYGSAALADGDNYILLCDSGEVNYMPDSGNFFVSADRFWKNFNIADGKDIFPDYEGPLCMLCPRPGRVRAMDISRLDEAHALSTVLAFGEGKPQLPQLKEMNAVKPAAPAGERYTLTSGRLTTAVYARPYGVSAANISLDTFGPAEEKAPFPVLAMTVKDIESGMLTTYTSEHGWDKVTVKAGKRELRIDLEKPQGLPIRVSITGRAKEPDTIAWNMRVINDSPNHSVTTAYWPGIGFSGGNPVFFKPSHAGIIEQDPYQRQERWSCRYPSGFDGVCPVLGVYDPAKKTGSGLYIAIHAPHAARVDINAAFFRNHTGYASFEYPAENLGLPYNSFQPGSELIVRVLDGDWYDMACIYEKFLTEQADWYAPLGREDSPAWMRDVPMYIMDWMPNDNPDADPVPISIRPPVEPPRDNWWKKPIELADKLGLPIGYHLYNWHFNPFNNDFPYYFPVKEGLVEGVDAMKEHGVHVMPYINGRIADTRARDLTTDLFDRTFGPSATRNQNGDLDIETYASHETDGSLCRLAAMCPSTHVWRETLANIVRRLFREYHMSAVYIDQVAAAPINTCCATNHNHQPGNGTWWVKDYRLLMARLKQECLPECGFTTESNAEVYADQFDGFLTWAWVFPNMVPFFPKLYAGRTAMLGRNTNGYKKYDRQYFRFHVGQAVMFGQQIGWINADVADDEEKMTFLYRLCHMRWDYRDYFSQGRMLRPPVAATPVPTFLTDSSMGKDDMIPAPLVVASSWQKDDTIILSAVNTGLEEQVVTFECHVDGLASSDQVHAYGDAEVIDVCGSSMTVRLGGASGLVLEHIAG